MREPLPRAGIADAAGLAIGVAINRVVEDGKQADVAGHFRKLAHIVEEKVYAPNRPAGVAFVLVLVGPLSLLARALHWRVRGRRLARLGLMAAVTASVLVSREVEDDAMGVAVALDQGDPDAVREPLSSMLGHDIEEFDQQGAVDAVIESVAIQTSEGIVGPLLWGALGGPAGLVTQQATRQLNSMVGHRSQRYREFGWASHRLNELMNWVPARLTALLGALFAPTIGGRTADTAHVASKYAPAHSHPNDGWAESAFAGALNVTLGGREDRYDDFVDLRPSMGSGPSPSAADIHRSLALARFITAGALAVSAALALLRRA